MARKRKKAESETGINQAEKKRKAVKTERINREHAGKVLKIYQILEELVEQNHPELEEAKFMLLWKHGWRPDADGILVGAKIRKASEFDKELDEFDFAILLNYELFNETKIEDLDKTIILDHELYHAAPEMDRDGEQKKDDRGRFCWRLRKHPIQEFPEVIKRYGLKKVTGLNASLLAALDDEKKRKEAAADNNDQKRPLLKDEKPAAVSGKDKPAAAEGKEAWRGHSINVLKLNSNQAEKLALADVRTLGELQDKMNRHGMFWAKECDCSRSRDAIESRFNQYIIENAE